MREKTMSPEELFDRAAQIADAVNKAESEDEYRKLCPKLLRHAHELSLIHI